MSSHTSADSVAAAASALAGLSVSDALPATLHLQVSGVQGTHEQDGAVHGGDGACLEVQPSTKLGGAKGMQGEQAVIEGELNNKLGGMAVQGEQAVNEEGKLSNKLGSMAVQGEQAVNEEGKLSNKFGGMAVQGEQAVNEEGKLSNKLGSMAVQGEQAVNEEGKLSNKLGSMSVQGEQAVNVEGPHANLHNKLGGVGGKLGGVSVALQTLREIISWPMKYANLIDALGVRIPRGLLLHGPPGCGKTLLVKTVAEEFGAFVQQVTAASVYGSYLGESEARLRGCFVEAERRAGETGKPVVIFLDEVDTLCPRRDNRQAHEARVVAQLLTLLDGAASHSQDRSPLNEQSQNILQPNNSSGVEPSKPGATSASRSLSRAAHVVVVAATNRPNAIDPALRRPGRLDKEVLVGVPNVEERAEILRLHTAGLPVDHKVDISSIAAACHGYVGADLAALAREAAMHAVSAKALQLLDNFQGDLSAAPLPAAVVTEDDFFAAMKRVGPSVVRGYEVQTAAVGWEDIGGLPEVKRRLRQAVEWPLRHKHAFERLNITPPRGVLLYGPPGCAKTTLVRAAATASGAALLPLSCAQLYSMYVGEGEGMLREVFNRARLAAPAIIFLDELDAVAAKRQGGDGGQSQGGAGGRANLLATLLTEMDGMEQATGVLVLGATNRPQALDAAVIRPGRFDTLIYVPPPDVEGRLEVLRVHTRSMPLAADVDLEQLAKETDMFTGAELAAFCSEAALSALREDLQGASEVATRHFLSARKIVKASLSTEMLQHFLTWGASNSR